MQRTMGILLVVMLLVIVGRAQGLDQAMPNQLPAGHQPIGPAPAGPADDSAPLAAQDRTAFRAAVKLDELRLLAVQHNDQVKILDSWARQSLTAIRNLQKIDGEDPLYTALDMAFRKEAWIDKNIIYVQAIPIRQQMAKLVTDPAEQQRIVEHATVSPRFMARRDVQQLLNQIASNVPLSQAVNKVLISQEAFENLYVSLLLLPPVEKGQPWLHPAQFGGNVPEMIELAARSGQKLPAIPGVGVAQSKLIFLPFFQLGDAWAANDVIGTNTSIAEMTKAYPEFNKAQYPTEFRRKLEYWYNLSFNGTIVAFVYFLAFVLFTVGAMAQQPRTRTAGMWAFGLAVTCHILAMSVRWYLAGRIPNQNQFESVLGAALIGCVVGFIAESIKRNGLFGMAFSFVGFLAMTCCFVFPFVIGKSIGENIGKVAGILNNTVWLYIHVNTVIASYALIAAAAVLGGAFLLARTWHWINPLTDQPGGALAPADHPAGQTPPIMFATAEIKILGLDTTQSIAAIEAGRRAMLDRIDAATVILLQMAMWVLGTGIVFGAIWADVSWGRPWGWDPKETFALVTWIVYLVIIHVRFITPKHRATVTAILAVVGLIIMLFNWIGVNFWLAGLHSYA
jgi:cytochrome c-type biogenesis protein CcsB